jgi:hypothetical protein
MNIHSVGPNYASWRNILTDSRYWRPEVQARTLDQPYKFHTDLAVRGVERLGSARAEVRRKPSHGR